MQFYHNSLLLNFYLQKSMNSQKHAKTVNSVQYCDISDYRIRTCSNYIFRRAFS